MRRLRSFHVSHFPFRPYDSFVPSRRDSGFALLLVLFLAALLAVVVVQFTFTSQVDAMTASRRLEAVRHEGAIRAGIAEAKRLLVYDFDLDTQEGKILDALDEPWTKERQVEIAEDHRVTLRIVDDDSLLALRLLTTPQGQVDDAQKARLERLLAQLPGELKETADPDLVEALLDWMDRAPQGQLEAGRFETGDFGTAKNDLLFTRKELLLVPGWTERLLYGYTKDDGSVQAGIGGFLARDLSAAAADPQVNMNTAPPEILRCLSVQMSEDRVQTILARRGQLPFESVQEAAGLFPSWTSFMDDVGQYLRVTTRTFAVEITSTVGGSEGSAGVSRRAVAFLQRSQQTVTILSVEPD